MALSVAEVEGAVAGVGAVVLRQVLLRLWLGLVLRQRLPVVGGWQSQVGCWA